MASLDHRLTNAACCENLFELFHLVNDHAKTTSMRTVILEEIGTVHGVRSRAHLFG
jgi:hypothetical protein